MNVKIIYLKLNMPIILFFLIICVIIYYILINQKRESKSSIGRQARCLVMILMLYLSFL